VRAGRGLARATGAWGHGALLEKLAAAYWGSIQEEGEERERDEIFARFCKDGCHQILQPSETNRLL
jgi:hypothetical protein